MEKKILEEILRIKKLIGSDFLVEQAMAPNMAPNTSLSTGPMALQPVSNQTQNSVSGFISDPCGVPEIPTQKFLDGNPIPRNSVDYRQESTTTPTLFNGVQDVMECWDFQLFNDQSSAANSMFLGDRQMYLDDVNGYYFFADENQQVRIYLPKDEFFKSMAGKVKSIVAYKTCKEACSSKGTQPDPSILYTLMYNLKNPKDAMLTTVMTEQGPILQDGGDISRGWSVDYSAVKDTGYFNVSGAIGKETYTPSDFAELSLEDYGTKFARSQFDTWYDSFGGTFLSVVVAVGVSVLSEGTLAPLMLEWVASQGARTLGVFLIKQTAEYIIAIPEFVYLKERGMDSQAAFIMLLAHIPFVERVWLQPKFKIDPDIVYGQTTELLNRYRQGTFKTPADFKNYLKTLPEAERKMMENVFKTVGDEMIKNPNLFRKSFAEEIQYVVKKASRGDLDKAQRAFTKLSNTHKFTIPTASQSLIKTAKIFGIIMFPAFGINAGLTELIEENPIVKDPAKLGKIVKALELLPGLIESNEANILKAKENEYKAKIDKALINEDYALLVEGTTSMLKILEDTDKVMGGTIKLTDKADTVFQSNKGTITSQYVSLYLGFIAKRIYNEKKESYKNGKGNYSVAETKAILALAMVVTDQALYTDFCSDITLTNPPKTKQESCVFRDWVIKNKSQFRFEGPMGKRMVKMFLSPCLGWEKNRNFTDDFFLKECGFKYAWESYGEFYLKQNKTSIGNQSLTKTPPKKPQ
jgi:hypothetical protein